MGILKTMPTPDPKSLHRLVDKDEQTRIPSSKIHNWIEPHPDAPFPAERDRYVLYIHYGCPWAHRANIARSLKGLGDVIQLVALDAMHPQKSWYFNGRNGLHKDPLYGFKYLRQLYEKADPNFQGRVALPTLWDKKQETIVSNESSDILRMFYSSFDALIPEELRESVKGDMGLYPSHLRLRIDEITSWIYSEINNGVYKAGFANTQAAYEEHVYPLFSALDRVEAHLSKPENQPYLFGKHLTDADIKLFPTIIRFDVVYYSLFKCNLKMIRLDYPKIHEWVRRLYWDESLLTNGGAFKNTTRFDEIKGGYTRATGNGIVPVGPNPSVLPLSV